MNGNKNAPADEAGAKIQNPRKERTMKDSTTPADSVTHTLWERAGLHLTVESRQPDQAPVLTLADGGATVTIGEPDAAIALAEALRSIASPPAVPAALAALEEARAWDEIPYIEPSHMADVDENLPREEYLDIARRRAAAIECGIPGCNRSGHHAMEDPSEWIHWLEQTTAGRLEVAVFVGSRAYAEMEGVPQGVRANVFLRIEDEPADENELRALAAELRSYATIVERQVNALELHTTALKRSQS